MDGPVNPNAPDVLHQPAGEMIGRLLLFALAYVSLYVGYMQIPDRLLGEVVYYHGIGSTAAALINAASPAEAVQAVGNRIVSAKGTLEIVRGCDGAGALFLLIAGIVAVRGSIGRVLAGIGGACLFVYLFNQARVIVLYFALVEDRALFTLLHSIVLPSLFVLLAMLFFVAWTRLDKPRPAASLRVA
jgi:exosortase family protein XrtM